MMAIMIHQMYDFHFQMSEDWAKFCQRFYVFCEKKTTFSCGNRLYYAADFSKQIASANQLIRFTLDSSSLHHYSTASWFSI